MMMRAGLHRQVGPILELRAASDSFSNEESAAGAAKTLHGRATVACIWARSGKRHLLVLAAGEQPGLSRMTSSSCGGRPGAPSARASRVAWL